MDDKQRERLEELRKADAERETREQEESDLRELEARELQASLEAKSLKKGTDFEIVSNRLGGVFALRKPDTRAIRNWEQADEKKKLSSEWQIGLIRNYVVDPDDKDPQKGRRGLEWAASCAKWPGLLWQTTDAWVELMSVDRDGIAKK